MTSPALMPLFTGQANRAAYLASASATTIAPRARGEQFRICGSAPSRADHRATTA